jgi:hypothetical protein
MCPAQAGREDAVVTMLPNENAELVQLLGQLADEQLTDAGRSRLIELLRNDAAARDYYLDYMELHARLILREERGTRDAGRGLGTSVPSVTAERSAFSTSSVAIPSPLSILHYPLSTTDSFVGSALFSYLIAAVILGIGLLVGAVTHVSQLEQLVQKPLPSPFGRGAGGEGSAARDAAHSAVVGQITGMFDCRLVGDSKTKDPIQKFEIRNSKSETTSKSPNLQISKFPVTLGDKFNLTSGLLEITYHTGARVILQGPVEYQVESPAGGYLSIGKLTARVDKGLGIRDKSPDIPHPSSLIPHPLFSVRTPTATATDLGTEFGVEVDTQGATTSYVFRGLVRVQVVAADGQPEGNAQLLHEDESVRVKKSPQQGGNRVVVLVPGSMTSNFVRELPRRTMKIFDLADVVAGGDGFSGRRNCGIDPRSGLAVDKVPDGPGEEYSSIGDAKYHRVAGLPFVDGVFVPQPSRAVQLDSAGHVFKWFPTSEGMTGGTVWAGKEGNNVTELGGVEYNSPGHGVLSMHANKGVTFDLDAIRRANPGWKPVRFRAVTGMGPRKVEGSVFADLWVFVDGEVRFQRREINTYSGAMPAMVPLGDKDRFLTLAATDGGDSIQWDHTIFGDPRLEMAPVKVPNGSTSVPEPAQH